MKKRRWMPEQDQAPCIWILDEEWPDYELERQIFARVLPWCDVVHSRPADYERDVPAYGRRAVALLTQIDVGMTEERIAQLPCCRIISNYGTGIDNIDTAAAMARQILVTGVSGYCADEIARYVLSAIREWGRPLHLYEQATRSGIWGLAAVQAVRASSPRELFLVGFGRIGQAVAARARTSGIIVSAWSPSLTPARAEACGARYKELSDGLASADVVSLHLRYEASTHHFIRAEQLRQMKETAILINTARGGIVDTAALLQAVRRQEIAGAVLDVLEQEPPRPDDPVLHTPGIIVTPHIAYYSPRAVHELRRRAAEHIVQALQETGKERFS
ncbi:C-terminal binding protein [uncultured Mitsuokella sp.]|uniref:C-terminal binding protein n=1 Tax=uncultured Mitsuokella sp. TaxID=453120 RepID=UPI0026316307|nr:C-terminal binding protein [uncultured Mitsuokella sp.]